MNEDYNNVNQNNDNDLMSNNENNTVNNLVNSTDNNVSNSTNNISNTDMNGNIFSDESMAVTSNVVTNNDTQDNSVDNNTQINTQSINNDQVSSVFTSNEIPKSKGSNFKGIIIAIIVVLSIIAITIGVLSVTGFFDNKKSNGDSGSNSGIIDNGNSNNNNSNTSVDLSAGYKIPLEEIYFSVPNWHETELTGYTEKFTKYGVYEDGVKKGERYVTITGNRNLKANSSKEAYEVCSKLFLKALGSTSAKEFKIEKEENVKINGIDMYKFEGKLYHYTSGLDRYTIGYAFTINGIALQITGVVVDDEQPEELITEMRNIVNEMAKHARTTE